MARMISGFIILARVLWEGGLPIRPPGLQYFLLWRPQTHRIYRTLGSFL